MANQSNNRFRSTVNVTPETLTRLADITHKRESYDAVINKLIDHYHNFTIKGNKKK